MRALSSLRLQAAVALVFAASPCLAGTFYSNLGPGNTWIINREYDVNSDYMATSFVTSGGGKLEDVLIPLFSLNNPVNMGLYTDSDGRPGTLLESWSATIPGFPGILTTLPSVDNPSLSADTTYWFVIDVAADQKLNLSWYENNQAVPGGVWFGNNLTGLIEALPASPAPAIALESVATSPVPEPSSASLFASCLGLIALTYWVGRKTHAQNQ